MQNQILQDREKRYFKIIELLKKYPTVISIHANIMGDNKSLFESYYLTNYFLNLVLTKIDGEVSFIESFDGPSYLIGTNRKHLKEMMIEIEESEEIGRLIDIDVFEDNNKSVSRNKRRTCLICGDEVAVCSRLKRHSSYELLSIVDNLVFNHLSMRISNLIEESMIEELELEDKFGLVTKTSNGSHNDMNYDLMLKAKDAILQYLVKAFELGYYTNDLENILEQSRPIGIEAEEQMLIATNGINCYKGLIFVFGITLMSIGYTLRNLGDFNSIFDNIKIIAKDLLSKQNSNNTFGDSARSKYDFKGVLGEVESGLKTVKEVISQYKDKTLTEADKHQILKALILKSEDSVFLKRVNSFNDYHKVKLLLNNVDVTDDFERKQFTKYAIYHNLSFGGSADLFVVLLFILKIDKWMVWKNEKNN